MAIKFKLWSSEKSMLMSVQGRPQHVTSHAVTVRGLQTHLEEVGGEVQCAWIVVRVVWAPLLCTHDVRGVQEGVALRNKK